MEYDEAIAWLQGKRSMCNIIPQDTMETWQVRTCEADAAMTQEAYWIAKAHKEGLLSTSLLGKIKTAWCHYNALNVELEYSLSEGGDTDVTRDQVNHAWEDLNSLIMPNRD